MSPWPAITSLTSAVSLVEISNTAMVRGEMRWLTNRSNAIAASTVRPRCTWPSTLKCVRPGATSTRTTPRSIIASRSPVNGSSTRMSLSPATARPSDCGMSAGPGAVAGGRAGTAVSVPLLQPPSSAASNTDAAWRISGFSHDWYDAFRVIRGINYPWTIFEGRANYGCDFGRNKWNSHTGVTAHAQDVRDDFAAMSAARLEVARWFVFTDGRGGIGWRAGGHVAGLGPSFDGDMDAARGIGA